MPYSKHGLSKTSFRLLETFTAAAKAWGYEADQGIGMQVEQAERDFLNARLELQQRLVYLEKELKCARRKCKLPHKKVR